MSQDVRTKWIGPAVILVLGFAVLCPVSVRATVNIYLKIDGVKGESSDDGRGGWIDAEEFLWGQSMPEDASKAAGQTGVDRAIPGRLTITKRVDRASPQLAELKAKGSTVASAVLDVPRRDGKPGRVITTMKNVRIVSLAAAPGGRSEKVTLAYQIYRVDFSSN
jgi:type VI protein secretion system component Hcp